MSLAFVVASEAVGAIPGTRAARRIVASFPQQAAGLPRLVVLPRTFKLRVGPQRVCALAYADVDGASSHASPIAQTGRKHGQPVSTVVEEGDLVIFQNGSMTDASPLGSMSKAPPSLTRVA